MTGAKKRWGCCNFACRASSPPTSQVSRTLRRLFVRSRNKFLTIWLRCHQPAMSLINGNFWLHRGHCSQRTFLLPDAPFSPSISKLSTSQTFSLFDFSWYASAFISALVFIIFPRHCWRNTALMAYFSAKRFRNQWIISTISSFFHHKECQFANTTFTAKTIRQPENVDAKMKTKPEGQCFFALA